MDTKRSGGREAALAALPALLLPWYDKNKRDLPWRQDTDPYRVWVSEIMLQQTRVEAAKEHYVRFLRALPTVEDLAACPEDKLLKLWEGLGYYSRARNLQKAAKIVAAQGFPATAEGWRKLPGIGDYTAGAIASIAFGQPTPAVDGNVIRVLSRLLGDDRPPEALKSSLFAELAPAYPQARCGDFTQSLMELGATVCTPASPLCLTCPLFELCRTRSDALPLPRRKQERKRSELTVLLFVRGGEAALCRRQSGVLRGMYGFFCIEQAMDAAGVQAFLRGAGMRSFALGERRAHRHVFTHLEWEMTAYVVLSEEDAAALQNSSAAADDAAAANQTAAAASAAGEAAAAKQSAPAHTDFAALQYFPVERIEREISLPSAFRWCLPLLRRAPARSKIGLNIRLDKFLHLGLGHEADVLAGERAVFEHHHARDAHDGVLAGEVGVVVYVDLDEFRLPFHLLAQAFHDGREHAAGAAPLCPKVDDERLFCLHRRAECRAIDRFHHCLFPPFFSVLGVSSTATTSMPKPRRLESSLSIAHTATKPRASPIRHSTAAHSSASKQ